MTSTPRQKEVSIGSRDLQAEVEARLASLEPEVEVLLAETVGAGRTPAVRVFLDRPAGVDHELCARVTRHLRDLLRDYTVEVSSPGPSRPLTKPEHYRRFRGRRARVRTREAVEGSTDLRGELVDADDEGITLAAGWGTVTIPHERIRRSNLVPEAIAVPRRNRGVS